DGHSEYHAHLPPRPYARIHILDRGPACLAFPATLHPSANQGGNDQQEQYAAEQPLQFHVVNRGRHQADPIRRRLLTASRARSRNVSFSSPGSACSGLPKVNRLSIGTGKTSPFGKIRFMFSRYAGTSSTSGRRNARWYSPARNGPTFSPFPRVPSG